MPIDEDVSICVDVNASIISFCLCSIILNFGLSTDIVALFLGHGVLTRWGIFGLYDGRYLRTFLSLNLGRCLWSFAIFNIASLCDNPSTKVRRLYTSGISWYALTACGVIFEILIKVLVCPCLVFVFSKRRPGCGHWDSSTTPAAAACSLHLLKVRLIFTMLLSMFVLSWPKQQ